MLLYQTSIRLYYLPTNLKPPTTYLLTRYGTTATCSLFSVLLYNILFFSYFLLIVLISWKPIFFFVSLYYSTTQSSTTYYYIIRRLQVRPLCCTSSSTSYHLIDSDHLHLGLSCVSLLYIYMYTTYIDLFFFPFSSARHYYFITIQSLHTTTTYVLRFLLLLHFFIYYLLKCLTQGQSCIKVFSIQIPIQQPLIMSLDGNEYVVMGMSLRKLELINAQYQYQLFNQG